MYTNAERLMAYNLGKLRISKRCQTGTGTLLPEKKTLIIPVTKVHKSRY